MFGYTIKSIKIAIILQREKFFSKFKNSNDSVILPITIQGSRRILICLPETNIDKISYQALILKYQTLFLGQPIQFCALSNLAPFIHSSCSCLFYTYSSLSILNKLNDSIKQVLVSTKYQLAIDLNHDFSLAAALICKTTGALTRITFAKPNARIFFNVLLQAKLTGWNGKDRLDIMKNYLQAIIQIKQ